MVRRAAYVGASVAASAAVILRAFHERPNFYSATVYLGQSTACRMILLNMLLLTLASSIYGLQRFLYGPLRAIEVEQLWDKAWYAITETALAMTTFRDEVGGYFFLMFMTLLAGKVWGWIAEGRVDTLEQQPPANPKTFHARMITSLVISEVFDLVMLRYCARSILDQKAPRAGMMVMFVFEFAILAINSTSTVARYALALQERYTIQKQTRVKMDERKEEIRIAREEARRLEIERATGDQTIPPPIPVTDDEIDENEIDVPGWQEKGVYILFLDLATDFLKLVFYIGFFMIIFFFAGIPIHMFRDLFLTTRSFLKRISDYLKYRNATRDMNTRYPDATPAELERDGTCIICREEMRPWEVPHNDAGAGAAPRANAAPPDERRRPKKLPCGHILHVSCLRSWLERQQVCPTCRRSVLGPNPSTTSTGAPRRQNQLQANGGNQPNGGAQPGNNANGQAPAPNQPGQQGQRANNGLRARTFNLGIARLTFATGNAEQLRNAFQQGRGQLGAIDAQNNPGEVARDASGANNSQGAGQRNGSTASASVQDQIQAMERQIQSEVNQLGIAQTQLGMIRALQTEISRLRLVATNPAYTDAAPNGTQRATQQPTIVPQPRLGAQPSTFPPQGPLPSVQQAQQHVLGSQPQDTMLGPGHADLPEGMALPEGWSLLPLHRLGPEPVVRDRENSEANLGDAVVGQAPYQPTASSTTGAAAQVPHDSSTTAAVSYGPTDDSTAAAVPESSRQALAAQLSQLAPPGSIQSASIDSVLGPSSANLQTDPVIIANGMTAAPAQQEAATTQDADSEPQLFTGLPNWGANRSPLPSTVQQNGSIDHDDPSNADVSQGVLPDHPSSSTLGSNQNGSADRDGRVDKGKGRAVTMEDEPDPNA